MRDINELTELVIGAALRIHTKLGPGLLESVYEIVLARDLARLGLQVERQKPIDFEFEGIRFEGGFKADLVIEGRLIVEIKSIATIPPVCEKQLLTYLRLADCRVGLLINFGAAHLKNGIKRVVNGLEPSAPSAPSA